MQSIWENTREDTFEYFAGIKDCYDALSDELSRKVFWSRLAFDLGEWDGYINLIHCSGLMSESDIRDNYGWVKEYAHNQKPVYIYGAGQFGGHTCAMLQKKGINVAGFFDRNYANIVERCGLPVLAPPTKPDENLRILISPSLPTKEIMETLYEAGLETKNFFNSAGMVIDEIHQYFDFPQYYSGNGLFIDAGCFNFETATRFHKWCGGKYDKILSFEPDEQNLLVCKQTAAFHGIERVDFVQAGLWNIGKQGSFGALGNSCSRIVNEDDDGTPIQLVALDDIVGQQHVSFLKMDIEGAELPALQGAAKTIMRDTPLCAISVYHKPGDQIAMMKYLKKLVPEYRFALRHYSNGAIETVLYAFNNRG